MNGVFFQRAKASGQPSLDRTTPHFSRIKNLKHLFSGHSNGLELRRVRRQSPSKSTNIFQNISFVGDFSTQYAIQCGWDGKPVWLIVDTGSSDTWAVKSGYRCEDSAGRMHDDAACGFGQPHVNNFGHGEVNGLHFSLNFRSQERVSGPMGYSDISCGGLSVAEQQVGLANRTYWHGNNVTIGVLGLAYPSITSAYYGRIGDETPWNAITYTPFLTRAIAQGAIDPVFSLAIMKNSSDGILAWGGLPPGKWDWGSNATTDLIVANMGSTDDASWRFSYYTIIPDGITWGMITDTTKYPYIVDSGTTMMHVPPPMAEQIAMAFEPRAVWLYQWGMYFAPCHAFPPRLAIIISGVKFWINPSHMMYKELVDPMTGYCAIAIASGESGPYILGDVFLQNVLAVFDIGGAKMRFYTRE